MRDVGQFFQVNARINLDISKRVKIFDRHIQLFCEKLSRVRHDGSTTGKEQTLGSGATLLPAVKLHGLVDLNMQPSHELTGDFRNRSLIRVFRLFVSSSEAYKAFLNL